MQWFVVHVNGEDRPHRISPVSKLQTIVATKFLLRS